MAFNHNSTAAPRHAVDCVYPCEQAVRLAMERANGAMRGGDRMIFELNMSNARHEAEDVAMREGRAFCLLPEWWFGYRQSRLGNETIPTHMWPKFQRQMRETEEWKNRHPSHRPPIGPVRHGASR
jgi:hypothetical protein